jgi:hypothetical protein
MHRKPRLGISIVAVAAATVVTVSACGSTTVHLRKDPTTTANPSSTNPATKLFADDFRGVCQGATVSRARAYDSGTAPHKVVLFTPYSGDLIEDTSTLPDDWMVQFDANADAYAKVDTVACVEVKDEQPLKECTGYQDNGHDTDNKVALKSATYSVSVHEATTGKELGTTELSGSDDSCPAIVSFENDSQTKDYDSPPPTDDLVAFLKPFVQP